jgi:hypothetical protein
MELEKFSIKDVVLGTKDLRDTTKRFLIKSFNYVEMAISYNNDFELGLILDKKTKVISRMSSLSRYQEMLTYHLTWLKRKKLDILLIDANGPWKDEDLLSLVSEQERFYTEFGLSGVEKIDDVKKILDLGIQIDWVSLVINPTYFNLELITYLRDSGIKIISYGTLGGIMAATNIEVYTLQFLLNFAALYSDLVCISGSSCEDVVMNRMILEKMVGKEVDELDKALYLFTSSRMVKRAPNKPLPLYRYIAKEGLSVKYKGPKDLYVPILSLEENGENIPETSGRDELEVYINSELKEMILPEDCIPGSDEAFAYWRYYTTALIGVNKRFSKYKYTYMKQGNLFLIHRKNRFKFGKKKSDLYLLAQTEIENVPVFKKMEEGIE